MKYGKCFLPLSILVSLLTGCSTPYKQYNVDAIRERWDTDIAAFDQRQEGMLSENPILFYGSSSIRLWATLAEDVAPFPAVNRGFGGATLPDAAYYAKRVLKPIDYRALVIFVANDIYGTENDRTPAEIEELVDYIVKTSRRLRKDAPVFLIEVTQTPSRANLIAEWDAANERLERYAAQREYVHFIPTRELYVRPDETIREELFQADGLHQNKAGYEVWKRRINEYLNEVLGGA